MTFLNWLILVICGGLSILYTISIIFFVVRGAAASMAVYLIKLVLIAVTSWAATGAYTRLFS